MVVPAITLAERELLRTMLEPLSYAQLCEVLDGVSEYRFNAPCPHVVRVVQGSKTRWLGRANVLLDSPVGALEFPSECEAFEAGVALENLAFALNGVELVSAAVRA